MVLNLTSSRSPRRKPHVLWGFVPSVLLARRAEGWLKDPGKGECGQLGLTTLPILGTPRRPASRIHTARHPAISWD